MFQCKPEYAVPGLYVIDAIVRQSRHQFSAEKDVYGPRFAKNMTQTFKLLFSKAPEGDRQRLAKVLMLWQQNDVFKADLVQPWLDSAAQMGIELPAEGLEMKPKEIEKTIPNEQQREATPPTPQQPGQTSMSLMPEANGTQNVELLNQLQQLSSQFQPSAGSGFYHHQPPPRIPNVPIQHPQSGPNVAPIHQHLQNAPIQRLQSSIPNAPAPVQLEHMRNVPPPAHGSPQKQSGGKNDAVTAVNVFLKFYPPFIPSTYNNRYCLYSLHFHPLARFYVYQNCALLRLAHF